GAVGESQRDHAAGALAVHVGIRCVVDVVTALFNREQQLLSTVHEFQVVHYNLLMLRVHQILASRVALMACVAALSACGQRGPLFLPSDPAARQRATLPETLTPARNLSPAPAQPGSPPPP